MTIKTNIEIMTKELHKAFDILNKRYFEGKLPLPAITIQSSGNRSLSMGWCTTKEVWHDNEGKINLYEINLSAEFINVSFHETMDTLMHEMVHLYNLVHNIKDTSRGGTYHNKRFLNQALKSGFIYPHDKPDPKYGYSFVKLSPDTIAILDTLPLDKNVFTIARKPPRLQVAANNSQEAEAPESAKRERKIFRWICPNCDLIMRSTKPSINVICGDCEERLINVENE